MRGAQGVGSLQRATGEYQHRPPEGIVTDAQIVQTYAMGNAGAQRLGAGLLCREALGQVTRRISFSVESLPFVRMQNALDSPRTVALIQTFDAIQRDQIDADASNAHEVRAAVMSAFISRVACSSPTNSARATMECPMLSSTTSGIAATADTLT